jgi:EAL domain-containing protein (putative c-di-GMP-specific phosphodiesterase class I)
MLDQVLNVAIEWARRARDRSVTVLALAVDDLSQLRRDYGAAPTEELLGIIGSRLAKLQKVAAVRTTDTFVLVSTAPRSRFDAFSLAERAARATQRTLVVDGYEITPAASIGIRVSHGLGSSGPMLLHDARVALDEARCRGRSEIVMFNPSLHRRRDDRADIRLQFEPIVALDDGHVMTYEAVVLSGPMPGFGDAEGPEFDALLEEVIRTVRTWPDDLCVSFNVSAAQVLDPDFPDRIATAADRARLAPQRFVLEIDEQEAAAALLDMEKAIMRLVEGGWRVGIDRLGGGHAPLDTIAVLPVQFGKIDRSMVDHADDDELELLATVTAAARSIDIATIATGISTLPELALAIAHDYDFAQGSLFGVQVSTPQPGPSRD